MQADALVTPNSPSVIMLRGHGLQGADIQPNTFPAAPAAGKEYVHCDVQWMVHFQQHWHERTTGLQRYDGQTSNCAASPSQCACHLTWHHAGQPTEYMLTFPIIKLFVALS